MFKRWIPSIRRIIITAASYIAAIVLLDVTDDDQIVVYAGVGIVVFAVSLLDEYFTAVRPSKKIEELAPITLDGLVDRLVAQLRDNGVVVRVNLMMMERTWPWFGLRRYFRMKWQKGMDNQPDVNLCFSVRYGVAGQCVRDGQPVYAGNQAVGKYSLPKKSDRLTKSLQAILSFPVYEPAGRNGIQSGKILGVLNLDSSTANAYDLITRQEVLNQINQVMQVTAAIAGRFFG